MTITLFDQSNGIPLMIQRDIIHPNNSKVYEEKAPYFLLILAGDGELTTNETSTSIIGKKVVYCSENSSVKLAAEKTALVVLKILEKGVEQKRIDKPFVIIRDIEKIQPMETTHEGIKHFGLGHPVYSQFYPDWPKDKKINTGFCLGFTMLAPGTEIKNTWDTNVILFPGDADNLPEVKLNDQPYKRMEMDCATLIPKSTTRIVKNRSNTTPLVFYGVLFPYWKDEYEMERIV